MSTAAGTENTLTTTPGGEEVHVTVDGVRIAAALDRPAGQEWGPLVVALHGGTYTREYWRVPGSPAPRRVPSSTPRPATATPY